MSLQNTFNSVLEKHVHRDGQVILGFSGGLDSRVMLELMAHYCQPKNIACLAVHIHHGLSPNADRWAEQCQRWCQQLGVECVVEKVELDTQGHSLEESARQARYGALSKYLHPKDLLLTGQHADDQMETFFLALKRGSGPKGLSSMAQAMPFGDAMLVRPFLTVSRQQIENYGRAKQLEWVEDESNLDQRFERNFVRHSITPVLIERWPHLHQSIQRSAELCAEQEQLLDELLADKYQACFAGDGGLEITMLEALTDRVRRRLIRMWLDESDLRMPSREQLNNIWHEVARAQPDANPKLTLESAQIRRYAHKLYIVRYWQPLDAWQQTLTFEQACHLPDALGTVTVIRSTQGRLSEQALNQSELRITFDPEGLSAHPAGRGHSRKLKKLFQEYGVPSWLRRRTPILMCGDQVVAVGDLFIDRRFIGQDCELVWGKESNFV
ncbi:tRNA(Ile)-lysidine synthetase [Vibrio galatheae]|uniref:tRNA(Ile)-lysidine synthase n=1 Tax=Vibrio galatheae TaxID=579748 RepID=A0A0F4NH96_9VIBR|nr:tRNA lysidine(34) synthetase TilS [Vibrio galatheae]KJY82324.1 tRNA(Ile)-lysidine synthetase [Vibrio galatheae]